MHCATDIFEGKRNAFCVNLNMTHCFCLMLRDFMVAGRCFLPQFHEKSIATTIFSYIVTRTLASHLLEKPDHAERKHVSNFYSN